MILPAKSLDLLIYISLIFLYYNLIRFHYTGCRAKVFKSTFVLVLSSLSFISIGTNRFEVDSLFFSLGLFLVHLLSTLDILIYLTFCVALKTILYYARIACNFFRFGFYFNRIKFKGNPLLDLY